MPKYKYTAEFEINAAPSLIYSQISTPVGLKAWFAEDVKTLDERKLDIVWDGVNHPAKVASWRTNHHIKYRFLASEEAQQESSSLEFKLEYSEMTQTTFLRVIDISDMDDEDELEELWNGLIEALRESVGG